MYAGLLNTTCSQHTHGEFQLDASGLLTSTTYHTPDRPRNVLLPINCVLCTLCTITIPFRFTHTSRCTVLAFFIDTSKYVLFGGNSEIRTHGAVGNPAVFKTATIDRSVMFPGGLGRSLTDDQRLMVEREGFEPSTGFLHWIMSPEPATNTASVPC